MKKCFVKLATVFAKTHFYSTNAYKIGWSVFPCNTFAILFLSLGISDLQKCFMPLMPGVNTTKPFSSLPH
jgi:hypothetical protein